MNLMQETTTETKELSNGSLDLSSPERAFWFTVLVIQARSSQRALDTVCGIYHSAATGEWNPCLDELSALIYAPLDNPSLIPYIESDMDQILNYHPAQCQLRIGWRYVQAFACNVVCPQPGGLVCVD